MRSDRRASVSSRVVMRKPERTKNRSTPRNPPFNRSLWKRRTAATATPRSPSRARTWRTVVIARNPCGHRCRRERSPLDLGEHAFDTQGMRSEATAESISRLHEAAARARPVALAREHVLPVLEPLQPVLPEGLRRGATVAAGTAPSLALALVAGPGAAGSWSAAVGVSHLGLAAAAELGVALDRLVVVADPPRESWATVIATLIDALDVVLVRVRHRVNGNAARRLVARARERGAVLVLLGDGWPEAPDVRLSIVRSEWEGIGDGHGYLQARRVTIEAEGRRAAAPARTIDVWLPAADGGIASVDELATVRELRTTA